MRCVGDTRCAQEHCGIHNYTIVLILPCTLRDEDSSVVIQVCSVSRKTPGLVMVPTRVDCTSRPIRPGLHDVMYAALFKRTSRVNLNLSSIVRFMYGCETTLNVHECRGRPKTCYH